MSATMDACGILALSEAKVVKVSSVSSEDCSLKAREWSLCSGCQSVVVKRLNQLFVEHEIPSFLTKEATGKGRRHGTKRIRLLTSKFKNAAAFRKALERYSPEVVNVKLAESLGSTSGGCPLHSADSWLSSPQTTFSKLSQGDKQLVCSIDLEAIRKVFEQQKEASGDCSSCRLWMSHMRDILTGSKSPAEVFEHRTAEFQPALFASLALGDTFPDFGPIGACSSCPENWKLSGLPPYQPTAGAVPSECQPWIASHTGIVSARHLCSKHAADAVKFPVKASALYVNPSHALCLMSQAVKTAGRRVGQTPKHTHSGKTAQCAVLEILGLTLLARLESLRRAQLQDRLASELAIGAILHCCTDKLHAVVATENQKKAQQAIRAAERDAARKSTPAAAQGAAADDADSASDSEDDFLAAQQDIYLKVKPHDMRSVARQVTSDTLLSHAAESPELWKEKSRNSVDSEGHWQQAAPPKSAVPAVSGWNLEPAAPAPPSPKPPVSIATNFAANPPAVSFSSAEFSSFAAQPPTTSATSVNFPSFAVQTSAVSSSSVFHSGLSLPSSQGVAETPLIPLSTAFTPSSSVPLPGAFPTPGAAVHGGLHTAGAGSMLGLGGMGATSESSLAVNSVLFAQAEQAEAHASRMSSDALKWAVDE